MLKRTPAYQYHPPQLHNLHCPLSDSLPEIIIFISIKMAPEIIDLTVDSPPSSPTHPDRSNPSSSTASDSSAVVMRNHQLRRPPGRRPRSTKYDYENFMRTELVNQQSLTGPAPIPAGPSQLQFDSNVHSSGNQNMQQSNQNLPDLDALWTEKEHE